VKRGSVKALVAVAALVLVAALGLTSGAAWAENTKLLPRSLSIGLSVGSQPARLRGETQFKVGATQERYSAL
jgi:hypothetical protein